MKEKNKLCWVLWRVALKIFAIFKYLILNRILILISNQSIIINIKIIINFFKLFPHYYRSLIIINFLVYFYFTNNYFIYLISLKRSQIITIESHEIFALSKKNLELAKINNYLTFFFKTRYSWHDVLNIAKNS